MTTHANLVGGDLHISRVATGTGAPNGRRTPLVEGEEYFDKTSQTYWVALAAGDINSWVADAGAGAFQPRAEKDQPNGYAGLDGGGLLKLAEIPSLPYDPAGSAAAVASSLASFEATAGQPDGLATLDGTGKVPLSELPPLNYIPLSQKDQPNGVPSLDGGGLIPVGEIPALPYDAAGSAAAVQGALNTFEATAGQPNGLATLDSSGKVPTSELPPLNYIPLAQKDAANGVPSLDGTMRIPVAELPTAAELTTNKDQANGYPSLDGTSKIPVAEIPDLSATYQVRSEKAAANGYASLDGTTKVPLAQIPTIPATGVSFAPTMAADFPSNPTTAQQALDAIGVSGVNLVLAPSAGQVVYVNQLGGNDTTGTGTLLRPYKTMTQAMAAITDASLTKRYTVIVAPGNYPENWALKGNIAIFGHGVIPTRFTGNVTLDSSFGTNTDQRSSFHNCSFIGGATFNFSTDGGNSPQGKLYFYSCRFNNLVTLTVGSAGTTVQNSFFLCHFFAGVTLNGGNPTSFSNCSFVNGGTITINAIGNNFTTTVVFYGGGSDGGMAINYVGSGLGPIIVTSLGFTLQGNITFPTFTGTGTGTPLTLTLTANSIQNNFTIPVGSVLVWLTHAFGVQYVPGAPARWASPQPTTVQQALDRIAAVVGAITPIP